MDVNDTHIFTDIGIFRPMSEATVVLQDMGIKLSGMSSSGLKQAVIAGGENGHLFVTRAIECVSETDGNKFDPFCLDDFRSMFEDIEDRLTELQRILTDRTIMNFETVNILIVKRGYTSTIANLQINGSLVERRKLLFFKRLQPVTKNSFMGFVTLSFNSGRHYENDEND